MLHLLEKLLFFHGECFLYVVSIVYNVNCLYYDIAKEVIIMATVPTQIRVDSAVKEQASALFASLGMDMSGAVNIFLRQCILRGGLPFAVEMPKYNKETLEAMAEAKRISKDPNVKGYCSIEELQAALDAD